jgi:hypothetical protein
MNNQVWIFAALLAACGGPLPPEEEAGEVEEVAEELSIHQCTLRPYAPFVHAGNLHAKGELRCSSSAGSGVVKTVLELWNNGRATEWSGSLGWCAFGAGGCTADGFQRAGTWIPGYWRTKIWVEQGGRVVRTAYTSYVYRSPW